MNDLLRPSLYSAYHEIVSVRRKSHETEITDVVGLSARLATFCARQETSLVDEGDLLAILDVGAYGSVLDRTTTRAAGGGSAGGWTRRK